ncbi:6-pyruvoyl tetrahydropterin synthase/QueD family protein [Sedimentisphaera cyanobacteriorum]|uniref:6-carboxy-5,6,7,8-tetrahydropterin synthase n=1 Tax=Sedimentisphaera cyanobacteriorum TaxID=1940790 RepID=A0A1Q2HNG2_9BACT|nr:6-carboxytetrahydropterin synthase [Sedimentisphaera cyanobacteriorum]AQQ08871.1 6-pyruvoyl tetrahydropterin synthase/QueD family protein [Sedimentisphaera cyanobacteriorum]
MHRLTRQIRFSVDPFGNEGDAEGFNSYCSKPAGHGLGFFICLNVELQGSVQADTGFLINLAEIDAKARTEAVNIYKKRIQQMISAGKNVTLEKNAEILMECWEGLRRSFNPQKLSSLEQLVNPYKKITISGDSNMLLYSEKFEFAATHKLWNENFSEHKNFEQFGKCANPQGHGHNYVVEITAEPENWKDFDRFDFQKKVKKLFIDKLDHKNLSKDLEYYKQHNPTVENITVHCWQTLSGKLKGARLESVRIWENDRAYCTYRGEQE